MSEAERLAERLRELLAKATPGPWSVGGIYSQPGTPDEKCWWQIVNDDDFGIGIVSEIEAGPDEFSSDLSLIVEAVNSLPTLLARIAALEDALREVMADWHSQGCYALHPLTDGAECDCGADKARNAARKALGKRSE